MPRKARVFGVFGSKDARIQIFAVFGFCGGRCPEGGHETLQQGAGSARTSMAPRGIDASIEVRGRVCLRMEARERTRVHAWVLPCLAEHAVLTPIGCNVATG